MDNLIRINNNNKLEIEAKNLDVNANSGTIKFDRPFTNKCVAVIAQDIGTEESFTIAVDKLSKSSFTFKTEGNNNPRWITYLAIGY